MNKFPDRGYKKLFSHPRMVEDLLKAFVKVDFVEDIDFTTLSRANGTFVTKEFRQREADLIWKVNFRDQPAFIYILIEFQSSNDNFMALRMLTYILLFYQDLICTSKGKIEKLPPVFPILLHSGLDKWRAPENIADLIDNPPKGMAPFIPSFSYYKISENQLDRRELDKLENLVAKLFSLEMSSLGEMSETATELLRMLKHNVPKELQRDFGRWIRSVFSIRDRNVDLTKLNDTEVKTMLAEAIKLHEEKLISEAMLQGKLEGKLEGKREGMREGMREGELKGKIEVATNMLKAGLSATQVAEFTGLSLDELNSLTN
ncbi:MAG: hypothetical protein CVV64_18350 [Candidatus Wallbacteria bacterium HGW-Wallbacteria-1]|jgi:predicted transposase/invertase (TIGR01784 family)|uniref:Transposase (putative) YhgA-like domain-containing protein n=1 Tax=Candidatus Wallbacteria bacterium HGW-Wallbacteria-1 TaxID=2013854 RepID=A0A2N1PJP4_9BACT|nr:MAG: hypothetical protein CVV64_18350 [Candidatus Wallbacteria bacterium HGW-Wallbacteria-1]